MSAQAVARKGTSFFKNWFAVEAIPIYFVVGGALSGASYYLYRLSTRPDVVWSRKNPEPWQTVKQTENTKFMSVNRAFDGKWNRDKF